MKNKWISIGPVYVISIALMVYAALFADYNTIQWWLAISLSLLCLGFYLYKRFRYINSRR